MKKNTWTAERVARYFNDVLNETKNNGNPKLAAHIRRIAPWLGFITRGLEKLNPDDQGIKHKRQWGFLHKAQWYVCRGSHTIGSSKVRRGGIEILPLNGKKYGKVVVEITSLAEAEAFYLDPAKALSA